MINTNGAVNKSMGEQLFYPVRSTPVHPILQILTIGLIKPCAVEVAEGFHYIADIGFNTRLHFSRSSVSQTKYFWRLNVKSNANFKVRAIPKHFNFIVDMSQIPIRDEFGNYIYFGYQFSVTIKIPSRQAVAKLQHLDSAYRKSPYDSYTLNTIFITLVEIIREVISEQGFKVATITPKTFLEPVKMLLEKEVKRKIHNTAREYDDCFEILNITSIRIEPDPELKKLAANIHQTLSLTRALDTITEAQWQRYLESICPDAAIVGRTKDRETRVKAYEVYVNSLLAMRLPIDEKDLRRQAEEIFSRIW